ncbi:MAG: type II toxin-antitoxin system VapC family toxin [Candidatus Kapaibacterium sp.]
MSYLLDTNAVINFLEASLPDAGMQMLTSIVDEEPMVSVITQIEALGFSFTSAQEQTTVETFINSSTVLGLSSDIVNTTIAIRKSRKIKLPDAIIAATAIIHDLTLITRNTSDFNNINGLKVIDPHSL